MMFEVAEDVEQIDDDLERGSKSHASPGKNQRGNLASKTYGRGSIEMKKGAGGSRKPAAGSPLKGRSPSKRTPKKQGGGKRAEDEDEEQAPTQ